MARQHFITVSVGGDAQTLGGGGYSRKAEARREAYQLVRLWRRGRGILASRFRQNGRQAYSGFTAVAAGTEGGRWELRFRGSCVGFVEVVTRESA